MQSRILKTLATIPRRLFHQPNLVAQADSPRAIPIGYHTTMSSPSVHQFLLQVGEPKLVEGSKVLDVGCGNGYLSACMAHLIGASGQLHAVDHVQELVALCTANLNRLSTQEKVPLSPFRVTLADGRKLYKKEHKMEQYDLINLGGCILPCQLDLFRPLLKPDGFLMCSIGKEYHDQQFYKITWKDMEMVTDSKVFVPLTSLEHQLSKEFLTDLWNQEKRLSSC